MREFLATEPETIVAKLSAAASDRSMPPSPESMVAWRSSVTGLHFAAQEWARLIQDSAQWMILLEYELPRRSRRVDAVVLARDLISLIEFKVGADNFGRDARWQMEQYSLDLRDFHAESRGRRIMPWLVATSAQSSLPRMGENKHQGIEELNCVNLEGLTSRLADFVGQSSGSDLVRIDG